MTQPFRLAAGGIVDRSRRLAFEFDGARYEGHPRRHARRPRCSPTACTSSRGASSITARAGSMPRAARSRTRWCSSRAARAPSPTCARRPPSSSTVSSRRARTAGPRSRSTSGALNGVLVALPAGRLLLQDVHVAADAESVAALRAFRTRRGRHGPCAPAERDPDRYEHQHAHCDVLVIGGGPAGLAAARARGRDAVRAWSSATRARGGAAA